MYFHDAQKQLTRVVAKDDITSLAVPDNLPVGSKDVGPGWVSMFTIIHKNGNVFLLEAMHVHDVVFHLLRFKSHLQQ